MSMPAERPDELVEGSIHRLAIQGKGEAIVYDPSQDEVDIRHRQLGCLGATVAKRTRIRPPSLGSRLIASA